MLYSRNLFQRNCDNDIKVLLNPHKKSHKFFYYHYISGLFLLAVSRWFDSSMI
ncbi:protein of unknown function [Moritella yayanosii]|uniref:Uncharacterized protein n=1 Tax=Moritella yayanosii TaxID=69539 RepID=A0A330LVB3_9GAMM|nr:protein of unknown function [Moritella yayanosii]